VGTDGGGRPGRTPGSTQARRGHGGAAGRAERQVGAGAVSARLRAGSGTNRVEWLVRGTGDQPGGAGGLSGRGPGRGRVRLFLQYAASGIATGCAFALVARGFVAIYRVTRVVNFAQGVFAVLAGMLRYTLLAWGVPHILAEAIAIVAAGLAGALVGLVAIGRRGTSPLASLVITPGLGLGSYAGL